MRPFKPARKAFSGQNLIEFALSAPFILVFMLVVVEAGRLWFCYEAVKMAAGDAAHTAAVYQNPSIGRAAAVRRLQAAGIKEASPVMVEQVNQQHAYRARVVGRFEPIFKAVAMPLISAGMFPEHFDIEYRQVKESNVY